MKDLSITDPEKFLANLCKPKDAEGKTPPRKGGGKERKSQKFFRECNSLQDLHAYDLRHEKDLYRLRAYRAEKFMMTPYLARMYMPFENGSLHRRAVYLRPETADEKSLVIQFFFYWAVDATHKKKKSFILTFSKDQFDDYKRWKTAIFDEQGTPRVKEVLIVADWISYPYPDCVFDLCATQACTHRVFTWVCTGTQTGCFQNDKQLFIVPEDCDDKA